MKRAFAALLLMIGVAQAQEVPGAIDPNVTQNNIQETICKQGYSHRVRPRAGWTGRLKHEAIRQYDPGANPRSYEWDHKVPIEDGGCADCVENMWLEPWRDPDHHSCQPEVMLDAACKDQLENLVHRAICDGSMALADGQAIFLGDWRTAYQQMIGDRPTHHRRR